MDALGVTEFTISRYIQRNSDNLTKAAALRVIRKITGMNDEQILEEKRHEVITERKPIIKWPARTWNT
jgi:hypothetical protein